VTASENIIINVLKKLMLCGTGLKLSAKDDGIIITFMMIMKNKKIVLLGGVFK